MSILIRSVQRFYLILLLGILLNAPVNSESTLRVQQNIHPEQLANEILADTTLTHVLDLARDLLRSGLNAGSSYGEVWIRDLNTFIELALDVQEPEQIRNSLLTFFHFQGEDGNIIDGYIPKSNANVGYDYIESDSRPDLLGHKNTVETDQESSLIQAMYKYVEKTGDRSILHEQIGGFTVTERLDKALQFLMDYRYNREFGLLWGATTVDWGDVQPEHEWGVVLDESSHKAIDIYDNAMFVTALKNYTELVGPAGLNYEKWTNQVVHIRKNVREYLWLPLIHKFIPHIYLDASPFPAWFDEYRIHYHGGTAVAIGADILGQKEIATVYNHMVNNMHFAGAASIGLTLYPPYPDGFFKNPSMKPFSYQNGGDWTWFGGRMIQQLIKYGFIAEAYNSLQPMVTRVIANDGFYEWYSVENEPRGSGTFRGSAGVLGKATTMLMDWANEQK